MIPKVAKQIEFEEKRQAIEEMISIARQRIRIAQNDRKTFTGSVMGALLEREIMCHQDAIIRLTIRLERLKFEYDL